jgi:predicted enzyme related to lactoylglutathione lyase
MPERTGYPDGEPCWADVVTTDLDTTCQFYADLFGWTFVNTGPEFGNYSMCFMNGKPVAGITPPGPGAEAPPPAWNVYLAAADVDETARRIEKAGGKIMMAPMDIPGSGRMVFGFDPTGAGFGIWQAGGHIGAQLVDEPGAPCWAELCTRDGSAADTFYRRLFEYDQRQIGDGKTFDYTVWRIGDDEVCGRLQIGEDHPIEGPAKWMLYYAVDNCDSAAERARRAGGTVRAEPFDSPYGRIALVADRQGALFHVVDLSRAQAEPEAG